MKSISKLKYGFLVLLVCILMNACNSSSDHNNPAVHAEEYPAFASEENIPDATAENEKTGLELKNTSSFHTIEIRQMKFLPNELKLHRGDTVLWINKDFTDHDVTEQTKRTWTSSRLSMGKSWVKVVDESADYFCSMHVVMKGKLIVE